MIDCFDADNHYKAMTGHHNHMGHRAIGKYKVGPGGMNCPCCTIMHPSKLKRKFARWMRRTSKQSLSKEQDLC